MRHATSWLTPCPRRRRFGTEAGLMAGILALTTTLSTPAFAGSTSSSTRTRSMAQNTASAATKSPVSETTLDNGLTVLIQEVHTAPVATFMVWYRVGSRNETAGITGISHLLEHMMFKGTPTLAKGEIAKVLQKNGAAFNAGTSLDYTNYFEVLASDRLELAMRIESDRMRNATIPEEEHRLEMTVVRSELERNEDNPHRALYLEAMAHAFKAHPYHWPTIGWRTDVEQIKTSQIRDYYKTHYVPNNATVVVVGDIDRDATLAMVKRYFGGIPRGPEPPAVSTVEPPQMGERRFKVRKPGDTSYFLAVFRNAALDHPDTYALDVLGIILGHGKTSRLYQGLVEKKLATDVDASNDTGRDPLLFTAQATVAQGSTLAKVEEAFFQEIERLKREPVTAQEVTRAKKQVEASFVYSKDSIRSLAQQLGYYNTIGSWRYLETYLDRVRAVTAADLQRVARTYLTEDARTVGWYEPTPARETAAGDQAKRSGASAPAQLFETAGEEPPSLRVGVGASRIVENYRSPDLEHAAQETEEAGASEATSAPARPSGAATKRSAPVDRTVLPNGLTLIVRRNSANPTISLQGLVKAGGIFDPPERSGLAGFVAAMLDQGTAKRTALQTAEAIENVGAHLGFEGGSETVSFSATMLSSDLPAVLDVLADALQRPSFPAENIEKIRSERITDYHVAESSTASVAARRANQLLYPVEHPYHRYPLGNDTTLSAITREDLISFHSRHYGPERTIIVLVGDVEAKRATELVRAAFGKWAKLGSAPEFRVPKAPAPSDTRQLTVPMKGKSQTDVVYATPGLERTAPDYDAAMVMSYILGGGSLSSRLMTSLRDEQGLVYGAYSSLAAGIGAGPFSIRAGTNPANADRAIASILEQVRRMVDEGPTEAEMTDAKDYLTGVFPVRLETNAGVAGQLLSAELYGLGLDYIERYTSIVRGITREQAAAAARAYLRPKSGYALVTAGSPPTPGGASSGP